MNLYGRCVLTGVLLLSGYLVMVRGLGMMNRPSDWSLYLGAGTVLALAVAMPLGLRWIWRNRQPGKVKGRGS